MYHYKFPDIGEGITEGTLAKWLVREGDEVKEGQDIVEIETDKMTTTLPAARSGRIHKIHVEEQGVLEVGNVFVEIDDGSAGDDAASEKGHEDDIPRDKTDEEAGVVGQLISSQEELPPSDEGQKAQEKRAAKNKALATPVARKLAKDLEVDIDEVTGTGPGGRVMKEDIRAFATKSEPLLTPSKESAGGGSDRREPLSRIRQTIAQKMMDSKDHLVSTTTLEEIEVGALVAFREKMKTIAGDEVKLTFLPFLLKAIVLALKAYPVFNSQYDEEEKAIVYKERYNIGIATDTERGLVVPVLFDADRKSVLELAREIHALAKGARENTLGIEALRGGTFSLTNYGAIGGSFGIPIINYPESAILGLGRIQEKPIVKDGRIQIGQILPLSLSFDHRIIDGASGIRFIRFLEEALSNPELLLLRS